MRYQFFPMIRPGSRQRRRHQAEILGILVGHDEQFAIAMVDMVAMSGFTSQHRMEAAFRLVRRQQADFSGVGALRLELNEFAVAADADIQVELLYRFAVHLDQFATKLQTQHQIGTLGSGVFLHQEQGLAVGGPCHAGDAFHRIVQQFPCAQILDVQPVLAITGGIGGVRQVTVIGTD